MGDRIPSFEKPRGMGVRDIVAITIVLCVGVAGMLAFLWYWLWAPDPSDIAIEYRVIEPGIQGKALLVSDVETEPDTPTRALLIAFPASEENTIAAAIPEFDSSADNFALRTFSISAVQISAFHGTAITTSTEGDYSLNVAPGAYFFCIGNLVPSGRITSFPAAMSGCVPMTIPGGERLDRNVLWGLAGMALSTT